MTEQRLARLNRLMTLHHLDTIALNPGPTLTYLTGLHFHLMERPTVLLYQAGSQPILILPELEAGKVSSAAIPITPVTFGDNPATWQSVFDSALVKWKTKKSNIGVEPNRLRFLELDYLQKAAPDAKFVSADEVLGSLRLQKEPSEIASMRRAVQIAQDSLKATLPFIKAGVTEKEVAAELTIQMLRAGSEPDLPFSPIVASGPNSANPHAVPTDRKLQRGDLVVIDWGAGYDGYFSDLTRTFAIGELSDELRSIFKAVLGANEAGRAIGEPEIAAGDVDRAARGVIDKAGYGQFFTHRTGHGLGMEAHEPPYMFGENNLPLAVGMVYTVEPGIYLPGKGGVRIEDDVVVTSNGCESLSDMPRDLVIL